MTEQEQNRNWSFLSEESKYYYQTEYKNRLEDSKRKIVDSEGGGDLTVLTSQYIADDLEKIFGKHNLQPSLTYADVENALFPENRTGITSIEIPTFSDRHVNKLVAINMLITTAKFLNKNEDGSDWVPDFDDENNEFYTISIDPYDDSVRIIDVNMQRVRTEIVYFRTKEIAQQTVRIIGEDVVMTALTIEY